MGVVEFAKVQCDGCQQWLSPFAEGNLWDATEFETPTQAERYAEVTGWLRDGELILCQECQHD